MPSFRSRMLVFMLRYRQILRGKKNREKTDWNTYEAVLRFREDVEKGAGVFGKLPPGIEIISADVEGMTAEWITPRQSKTDKTILYFHGGGYVSGTCRAHRAVVAKFVQASATRALLFEYRLAPEHPFPAALEDAVRAYRWLLAQDIAPADIVFVGDSAGGGLLLATLLALRDQGIALPAAAAALSPVTDYTCSGESYRTNAKVCLAPEGTGPAFARHYAGENDPAIPYISPLFGELQGLPPLLLFVGSHETLLDDSLRFAEKAQLAGVEVTLRVGEGLFHCYPACSPLFPEARRAMDEIAGFIQKK